MDTLADVYYCEQHLERTLLKIAKAATHEDLLQTFEAYSSECRRHARMCEEIFGIFGQKPRAKRCAGIMGIIQEVEEFISENKKFPTINAVLILGGQQAVHYKMAGYGTLREWALHLEREDAAQVLGDILADEKAADARFTKLARERFNSAAKTGEDMRMAA